MAQSPDENFTSVNIEQLIERYTWDKFRNSLGFPKKLFTRQKNYFVDIRWGFLEFEHKTTRKDVRPNIEQDAAGGKPVVLYYSEYENKTPVEQEYTFQISRETSTSATVELQDNYTIGAETNLEVKLPGDILTVSAGLSSELSVTKTNSQTYSDTLTWSVDTKISVPKGHFARANLCVHEKTEIVDFEVETTLTLPKGRLPIAVRRKSDDKIMFTLYITNLRPLFRKIEGDNVRIEEYQEDKKVKYKVILISRGTCKSVAWKDQSVKVDSERISGYDPESNSD